MLQALDLILKNDEIEVINPDNNEEAKRWKLLIFIRISKFYDSLFKKIKDDLHL